MTAPALDKTETNGGGDDAATTATAESIWTPSGEDALNNGFIVHRGLYVTGVQAPNDDSYPAAFLLLGHQRWADIIEAAAAYMNRIHNWRDLHLYPGDDPLVLIPRIPRAVHTHGVFLRHAHPYPDRPCGCEGEGTWRMAWASATEPDATPVTAMRHPAAPAAAAGIPNPDDDATAIWAA
ncbi:hypothetical protein ACFU96_44970 [Streptomyces sp. NPDC057620]|uniref:hypothetical protein n=1 Tax=Streptomyces sp. NPDC057620 TaxID=3346185 RepID=UPI0036B05EB3